MQHTTTRTSPTNALRNDSHRTSRHRGTTWTDPALNGYSHHELHRLIGHHDRDTYAPIVSALASAAQQGDATAGTILTLGIVQHLADRSRTSATSTRRYLDDLTTDLWIATATCSNTDSRYARENIIRQARRPYVASKQRNDPSDARLFEDVELLDAVSHNAEREVEQQALTSCHLDALLDDLTATQRITPATRRVLLATAYGTAEHLAPRTQEAAYRRRRRQLNSARTQRTHDALVA